MITKIFIMVFLGLALECAHAFTAEDFTQHVAKLRAKLPEAGFTIVVQSPFVVIGDESPKMVRDRALRTVKWATDRLKAKYFPKDPKSIIDIWLFKNKVSYRKYAREIFGDEPTTPFGYSSTRHKALIMNIGTGGGTLVHEMVHPFMDANFPECPAWFNEGLGSLYEQCADRSGAIRGLTNWRLAGLQTAIKRNKLPSFKKLTGMTPAEFYDDRDDHYAQARYLCYYLQEKGLLKKFYQKFHDNYQADPTGYATLQAVLGVKDMDAFKVSWQKFVLGLRFP